VKRELLKEGASTGVLRTQVTFNDFVKVLSQVKPSVSPEQIKVYEEFKNRKW
jgi:Vps4 C terminal oligomerisation domain.